MLLNENRYFLYESRVKDDLVMGNGNMLVYLNKADLLSFHGNGYTTPSFLELACSFGGEEFVCRSARNEHTSTYVHKLYELGGFNTVRKTVKSIEDARIVDVIHPSSQIFVRYCENILPFRFDLKIPPYTHKVLNERYKIGQKYYMVLTLIIPAGVSFYKNEVTFSESRMLIVVDGDVRFSSDGSSIELLVGTSRVIFVTGDGRSCIENAKFALEDTSFFEGKSQIVYESEAFWKNEILRSKISGDHRDREMLEDALIALLSHQSSQGGVIAGFGEPIIRSDSIDDTVSAFLKLGLIDSAKRVLEFFSKRFELYGQFYQIYGTGAGQFERYFSDSALGCAKLITAFMNYADVTDDIEFVKENFVMLKKAMYAQVKEITLGMLPFSGCEPEITDEILGARVQCQGSLESTVAAYVAFRRFIEFCDKHSLILQNDNGSSVRRTNELADSIERYFIVGDKVTLNAPVREKNIKKHRFTYGDCDVCRSRLFHVYYGELELGSNGVYMCPKCYNDNFGTEPFAEDISYLPQASALLFSKPEICDLLGIKKMTRIFESAVKERLEDTLVRTVRSDTYFLEAAKFFGMDEYAETFRTFIKHDIEDAVYPRTVDYNVTKGKFDTRTIARIISAFI